MNNFASTRRSKEMCLTSFAGILLKSFNDGLSPPHETGVDVLPILELVPVALSFRSTGSKIDLEE